MSNIYIRTHQSFYRKENVPRFFNEANPEAKKVLKRKGFFTEFEDESSVDIIQIIQETALRGTTRERLTVKANLLARIVKMLRGDIGESVDLKKFITALVEKNLLNEAIKKIDNDSNVPDEIKRKIREISSSVSNSKKR